MARSPGPVLLKQKAATLFRHFPFALAGDEEALHQVRVWGRRLRVALRLLSARPDGDRVHRAQRRLAQLTRTAGFARDLDVLLATFDERLKGLAGRTVEQKRLRQRLAALRRRGRTRTLQALLDLEIARLRVDLAKLLVRGGPDRLEIGRRIRAMCEREYGKLHDGFSAIGAHLDVVQLHALRRRARRVRYAVEVYLEVFGGDAAATKPWKTLQDHIGVLHDHHVLAEWLAEQAQKDRKRSQPALADAAATEVQWAREAMARLHDELLVANPIALIKRGLAAVSPTRPEPGC
jgi:CHAD domain-containing protein